MGNAGDGYQLTDFALRTTLGDTSQDGRCMYALGDWRGPFHRGNVVVEGLMARFRGKRGRGKRLQTCGFGKR